MDLILDERVALGNAIVPKTGFAGTIPTLDAVHPADGGHRILPEHPVFDLLAVGGVLHGVVIVVIAASGGQQEEIGDDLVQVAAEGIIAPICHLTQFALDVVVGDDIDGDEVCLGFAVGQAHTAGLNVVISVAFGDNAAAGLAEIVFIQAGETGQMLGWPQCRPLSNVVLSVMDVP